jgi:O-antigen/teichoic acid export membrane protein
MALVLPFATLTSLSLVTLQGMGKVRLSALLEKLLEPTVKVILLSASILLWGRTVLAAIHAFSWSTLLIAVAAAVLLWRNLPPSQADGRRLREAAPLRPLLLFSLPIMLTSLAGFILNWADIVLVGHYRNGAAAGIYGAATRFGTVGGMTLLSIGYAFVPRIYELYGGKHIDEIRRLFQTVTRWLIIVNLPILFLLWFNGPLLLKVFGREYLPAMPVLMVVALGTFFNTAAGPAGVFLYMVGKVKLTSAASLIAGAINLLLDLYLIPRYGVIGAAWAGVLTIILDNCFSVVANWRLIGIQPYTRAYWKPFASASATAAGLWGLSLGGIVSPGSWPGAVVSMLMWAGVYPLILFSFKWELDEKAVWDALRARLKKHF